MEPGREPIREEDTEFLSNLEDRILKAVELVNSLRKDNAALKERLDVVEGENADANRELVALRKDLDSLRAERKQVRSRIEKLLGQMDLLSAS